MRTDRTSAEPTLLPSGRDGRPRPEDARPGPARGPRRLRWDIALGCLLGLVAVSATVAAVAGLRGPAPATERTPATSPGSVVTVARTGADGLRVTERVTLPRPPDVLHLTRPDLTSDRSLTLPRPTVSGLTATADGTAAPVRGTGNGWDVSVPSGSPQEVTISYDVTGAVVAEPQAAVPGRALLVVTPLSADAARDQGVPVSVSAPGIAVRQATCVTSPATQQLCGTSDASGWTARLTTWQGVAVVVLQADLDV